MMIRRKRHSENHPREQVSAAQGKVGGDYSKPKFRSGRLNRDTQLSFLELFIYAILGGALIPFQGF